MHSTIPVPTVFDYATSSNQANTLGISYILMEKLPGIPLPTFEEGQNGLLNFDPSPAQLQLAHKVHQQLTDVIIELGNNFPLSTANPL
jgi:hypothetical protein